jgi:hypothetical protein
MCNDVPSNDIPIWLFKRDFVRVLSKLNMKLPDIFGQSPADHGDI